jgi:two-component system, sensor histidine kinase RegB
MESATLGRLLPGPADSLEPEAATARQNLLQLVKLRWIAVAGQLVTIAFAVIALHITLPLMKMGVVMAAFVALNLVSQRRLRWSTPVTNLELFYSLTLDALVLTALLYYSGGATNPFTSLYLLHVILGAVLLKRWAVWAMVGVTVTGFLGLLAMHYPLVLPSEGPGLMALYVGGAFVGFILDAVLLVVFMSRISDNLRQRDDRLAALRQQAAEEDHIVRMGLLASGAAHELGTPLATLDVILGDWRRMEKLAEDETLAREIEDMRAEVARCKAIVTGVLVSAGEARGDHAELSTLKTYLTSVFEDWRLRCPAAIARYQDDLADDPAIVADSALKQAICNLLDNAFEASAKTPILFRASVAQSELTLSVEDEGPGFAPEALAALGKPYQSTKARIGGGLGLFLVANVARKLDGRMEATNRPTGGARVAIVIPLKALELGETA